MRKYVSGERADQIVTAGPTLSYPNAEVNRLAFPLIEGNIAPPSTLLLEAMHLIGREPKTILDIGALTCTGSLYLAAHGHMVRAIDIDTDNLEWAREKARELGIPNKNFVPEVQDARDLPATTRYDVILATMFLHCLSKSEGDKTLSGVQSITRPEGINVVSTYTSDNPEEEVSVRGLRHLFGRGELAAKYRRHGWQMHRDEEGFLPVKLDRAPWIQSVEPLYLVPTVAEVIAQKQ